MQISYRKLWFLITRKLLVVPHWNLVCPFIIAVPRDVFKHFWKFQFFRKLFCKNVQISYPGLKTKPIEVAQWNLVRTFFLALPRATMKQFLKFHFFANLWLFNAWLKSSCRLLKFGKQADFYLTIVDRTILSLVISLFLPVNLRQLNLVWSFLKTIPSGDSWKIQLTSHCSRFKNNFFKFSSFFAVFPRNNIFFVLKPKLLVVARWNLLCTLIMPMAWHPGGVFWEILKKSVPLPLKKT